MIVMWDPVENHSIRGLWRPGVNRMPERGTETAMVSLNWRDIGGITETHLTEGKLRPERGHGGSKVPPDVSSGAGLLPSELQTAPPCVWARCGREIQPGLHDFWQG